MKDNAYKRMAARLNAFNAWELDEMRRSTRKQTAWRFRELFALKDHLAPETVARAQEAHLLSLIQIQRGLKKAVHKV